jgi:hypothetical protein
VYHLYGANWGDSNRAWKIERDALADAMHLDLAAHVSGVNRLGGSGIGWDEGGEGRAG